MLEMGRQAWLTVSALALFGLSGPLCALACLADTQVLAPAAQSSEMPCHEQGPPEPGDSERDCDCVSASAPALLAFEAPVRMGCLVVPLPSLRAAARTHAPEPSVPRAERIPPPDILLLKSTLLV